MVNNTAFVVTTIVGRPNVGKSTLFNALTGTRDALVADLSGLTRDRKYGQAYLDEDTSMTLVDTGGMYGEEGSLTDLMDNQIKQAMDEAHIILFVVSARDGLLASDVSIMERIRLLGKPILLIINKSEGLSAEAAKSDFYQLGLEKNLVVSASHRSGLSVLKSQLLSLVENIGKDCLTQVAGHGPRITIIGRPNVGKSTLVNRLLRAERVLAFDSPGTTRDSISLELDWDDRAYTLVDTAGVRKKGRVHEIAEKFSVVKTLQSIELADICLLLIDAKEGITEQDVSLLGLIVNQAKPVVLAINKWDNLSELKKESIKQDIDRKLVAFTWVPRVTISALHGSGLRHMMDRLDDVLEKASQVLQTNQLTNVLKESISAHQPPMVQGRSSQLKYAHFGGNKPTRIIIHGNRTSKLPASYKKYLENQFRKAFNLLGVPLVLRFLDGNNPFGDHLNTKKNNINKTKKQRIGMSGRGKK